MRKPRNYWNYDNCFNEAKKYHSKSEMLRTNKPAYNVAYRNKWLDDYTWFLSTQEIKSLPRPDRVKWTYEVCRELALECETIGEYNKKHHLAYVAAGRKGWTKDFKWLQRYGKTKIESTDNIYVYYFLSTKCVYVGRTISPRERDCSHRRQRSSVYKFAKKNNLPIPKMQILESGLSVEDGVIREDYWVHYFLDRGFYVINIAKTGEGKGSIGGLGYGKWDYDACYNEAKKYTRMVDFKRNNGSAYYRASVSGWKKDYYWLYSKKKSA